MTAIETATGGTPVERLTVSEVMSTDLLVVTADESVIMCWELMARAGVHHLPIVTEAGQFRGVIDAATIAKLWDAGGPDRIRTPVRDLVTDRTHGWVHPDDPALTTRTRLAGTGPFAAHSDVSTRSRLAWPSVGTGTIDSSRTGRTSCAGALAGSRPKVLGPGDLAPSIIVLGPQQGEDIGEPRFMEVVMPSDRDCRVVVGVDGSPASIAALRWAAQAAMERDAPLCVVGVDPDVHDSTGPYVWQSSRPEERLTALRDTLAVAINAGLGPEPGVEVSQQVERGRPGEVLARVADKAELLVLGSRRVDVDEPLRPVLRACIQLATCPVVVVTEATDD